MLYQHKNIDEKHFMMCLFQLLFGYYLFHVFVPLLWIVAGVCFFYFFLFSSPITTSYSRAQMIEKKTVNISQQYRHTNKQLFCRRTSFCIRCILGSFSHWRFSMVFTHKHKHTQRPHFVSIHSNFQISCIRIKKKEQKIAQSITGEQKIHMSTF